jgi:L-ascorbate metabolism protein UlaG (beta-lactamase superfamily)
MNPLFRIAVAAGPSTGLCQTARKKNGAGIIVTTLVLGFLGGTLAARFSQSDEHNSFNDSSTAFDPSVVQSIRAWPDSDPLSARFLGATTIAFSDGTSQLLIDAFLSRKSPQKLFAEPLASDPALVEQVFRFAGLDRVKSIFVSHSHFDHILDLGTIAQKTGANVYGSFSTRNVALGAGVAPRQIHMLKAQQKVSVGNMQVSMFETPHSPFVTFPGRIDEPLSQPARMSRFREGGNYSFHVSSGSKSALVVPSANFTIGAFNEVKADVVFLGVGALGRQDASFIEDYWSEVVLPTGARKVVLIHWDDFTRPLSKPLKPFPSFIDGFDDAVKALEHLAERDGVTLKRPHSFELLTWRGHH